jgi:3D (Asp-Asp-Asp) domain-containing protein
MKRRRSKPVPLPIVARGRLAFERLLAIIVLIAAIPVFMMMEGCRTIGIRPPAGSKPTTVFMEVTGYDSGPRSCGWERDWLGRPVYSYGPMKGKRKQVGITANGRRAKHGTVAADTRHYPFGTVLYIPGYGYGRVEDRGGDIKGPARLDLWFPNERAALNWGRRKNVRVTVWKKP